MRSNTAARLRMSQKKHWARLRAYIVVVVFLAVSACAGAQLVALSGLRASAGKGTVRGLRADVAGNLFLLYDQGDGVRIYKLNAEGDTVLASAVLGSAGDTGAGLAIDPTGNVYVAGTSESTGTIAGMGGVTYPARADGSVNSFAAKLSNSLGVQWVSFLGAGRTAASAIATNGTTVVVTGATYNFAFPVTPNGIQQTPAPASGGNGFVEAFNANSGTVAYATYLTGANGDTTPLAVAEDSAGNAYVAGSLTATGFPTVNAIIPRILTQNGSSSSGFLCKLNAAGDGFVFSTFIPGDGIQSVAMDDVGTGLLLSGNVATGLFPVSHAQVPLGGVKYQALLRMSADGQSVLGGTMLAPGMQSVVTAAPDGGAWIAQPLTTPLLPLNTLQEIGNAALMRVNAAGDVDAASRLGGIAVGNTAFASIGVNAIGVAATGASAAAGLSLTPTMSSTLLGTQRFDVPLVHAPNAALPSTVRDAVPATCFGQCQGSAAMLARVDANASAASIALSVDGLPNIVVRNLGTAAATGVNVSVSGYTFATSCGSTLATGAVCEIALTGSGPGTLTVSAANAATASATVGTNTAAPQTIVVSPKELDFGIQTAGSTAKTRTFTVTNLGSTSQTFVSAVNGVSSPGWTFVEAKTDCTPSGAPDTKVLAPGASCHVTLGFTASADATNDGAVETRWTVGPQEVLLTGISQAAALGVSAHVIDFGRRFTNGVRMPRYLYLSNASTNPLAHARFAMPAGSPFTVIDGCSETLVPESVCRIEFDYLAAHAPSADALTLTLDDGSSLLVQGETVLPPLATGSAVNPNLAVTPSSVVFSTDVAATSVSSETHTVTISNTGVTAFPLTLAVTGEFTYETNCGATLAGGASCDVILSFAPASGGVRQGLLAVTAGDASPAYVDLTGTATAILPNNTALASFGDVPVGVPAVQWIKVQQPFTTMTATVSGGDFGVVMVEDQGYGHGTPQASAFASSATGTCFNCWIGVQFKPGEVGAQTATIALHSATGGTDYALQVTGTGLPLSGVLLTPTSLDYGPVMVGSTSAPEIFLFTNATDAAVTVAVPATSGDFHYAAISTGATACGQTLAAGASCEFPVVFAPKAVGLRTGSVISTTSEGTVSSTLSGYGSPAAGVAFLPGSLRFDNVPGAEATQQTITVKNTGTGPLTVGTPANDVANFSFVNGCGTVAVGATCSITVRFAPGNARVIDTLDVPVTTSVGGAAQTNVYVLPLTGDYTVEDASLQIVPEEMNFGSGATSVPGTSRVFRVNNLTSRAMTMQVSMPRQYALMQNGCAGLAPNASCTLTAQFVPLTQGDITGTIFLTGMPTDGSATVNALGFFEGYGVGANRLDVSGAIDINGVLNFGQIASGQTATRVLTLTNRGGAATGSTDVNVRRVTSGFPFLSTTTCGAVLALNQSCTVTVTYSPIFQAASGSPTSAQNDTGVVVIDTDAANGPLMVDLAGQATAQIVSSPNNNAPLVAIVTSQGTLTFASTAAGEQSAPQPVTITNTGTQTVHVTGLLTGTDFAATSDCGTLLPGAACTAQVRFTPQAAGARVDALEIQSDASVSLEFVSLLGTGTPAALSVSPTSLDFGGVQVGLTSAVQSVTLTNNGASAITLGLAEIAGEYAVAGGTCAASGDSLAAGASCTIAVTFSPLGTGARRGVLSIASSATTLPLQVALTGLGSIPLLTATPDVLSFGDVPVGQSRSLSFTLANNSTTDVTGLLITSDNAAFTATTTCGVTVLRAGSSCSVTVQFAPATVGAQTGTLSIASSDPASPLLVNMSGVGVQGGNFTLTIDGGASSSKTVAQGLPATFSLAVTPLAGFGGTVAITCAPTQPVSYMYCSTDPSTVFLANGVQTSMLTITTVSATTTAFVQRSPLSRVWLAVLVLPVLIVRRRRLAGLITVMLIAVFASEGCGGGGDGRIRYAAPGTYAFTVTASSTTGVPVSQTVTANVTVTKR